MYLKHILYNTIQNSDPSEIVIYFTRCSLLPFLNLWLSPLSGPWGGNVLYIFLLRFFFTKNVYPPPERIPNYATDCEHGRSGVTQSVIQIIKYFIIYGPQCTTAEQCRYVKQPCYRPVVLKLWSAAPSYSCRGSAAALTPFISQYVTWVHYYDTFGLLLLLSRIIE